MYITIYLKLYKNVDVFKYSRLKIINKSWWCILQFSTNVPMFHKYIDTFLTCAKNL